ncbi:MAG: hypothetical protein K2G83_01770, partial [Ruminococcus sp.]|nr:hypothetical protein [Ruminococcus sp.]
SDMRYSVLSNLNGKIESRDPRIINWYLNSLKSNTPDDLKKSVINFFGRDLVPMLKERVDLTNPKEKGNIVEYVGDLAGADENDWYILLAENEENPIAVRSAAVSNLAYDKSNSERIFEIYKTSKGKVKDSAAFALAKLDTPEAEPILKKVTAGKFAKKNAELIAVSGNKIAVDFAIEYAEKSFSNFGRKKVEHNGYDYDLAIEMLANKPEAEDVLFYLSNQDSELMRMFWILAILTENLAGNKDEKFRVLIENLYKRNPDYFGPAFLMLNAFENRGVKISDYPEIVSKYRDFFIRQFRNIKYDSVNQCYMNGKNTLDKNKIYDILEMLTDTSYLEKTKKLLMSKKHDEKERNKCSCAGEACTALNNILGSASENDKDRIYKLMIDFCKAVMNKRPNKSAFSILLENEKRYITENPHLLENMIMYHLKNNTMLYFHDICDEIPRDMIDTAVLPLYKKLRTNAKKYSENGAFRLIINTLAYVLNHNGYDVMMTF